MEQHENNTTVNQTSTLKKVWRFFSSIRLALVLILLMGAITLFGTLVPSANTFHAWWFLAPGALLMLNIIVCSLNRWGNIKLSLHGGKVKQEESFYSGGNDHTAIETSNLPSGETAADTIKVLQKHGYRVRTESSGGNVYIAADKNRWFRLGTYASHLSLVLFVLAYLLGSFFGFRDTNFTVAVGSTQPLNHSTGLSLQLVSFVDEYYADNMPKDYRSEVILLENGQIVKQGLVRVNHPLSYKGISIHQMFFGPAVTMLLTQNGQTLYQGNIALDNLVSNQGLERYVGTLDLQGGLNVQLISSAINVVDPAIPPGQIAVYVKNNGVQTGVDTVQNGDTRTIGEISFNYQDDSKFSGFQVSRDPGNGLIWIASVLFIVGITLVLYFPYRQVWILSQAQSADYGRLLIRLGVSRGYNGTMELNNISAGIQKAISNGQGK
jgi:cytochrome c biogenesis protein